MFRKRREIQIKTQLTQQPYYLETLPSIVRELDLVILSKTLAIIKQMNRMSVTPCMHVTSEASDA